MQAAPFENMQLYQSHYEKVCDPVNGCDAFPESFSSFLTVIALDDRSTTNLNTSADNIRLKICKAVKRSLQARLQSMPVLQLTI